MFFFLFLGRSIQEHFTLFHILLGKGGIMYMFTDYVLKQGDIGISVNKMQAYLNLFQERGIIITRNL